MLAVFDVFDKWISWFNIKGCSFIKMLPDDGERGNQVRSAAAPCHKTISAFLSQSAEDASVRDADRIAMERP